MESSWRHHHSGELVRQCNGSIRADALATLRWNDYKVVLSMVSDGVKLNVLADGSNRLGVSPKRNIGAAVRSECCVGSAKFP